MLQPRNGRVQGGAVQQSWRKGDVRQSLQGQAQETGLLVGLPQV